MKKLVGFLGAVGLTFLLVVGLPLNSSVTANSSESDAELTLSKVVTDTKYFSKNEIIPETIYYSLGGWTGTLKKVRYEPIGTRIKVDYEGTVFCSGPCILNADPDS